MKHVSLAVSILMILPIVLTGCSREKPANKPAQKVVVKTPITVPVGNETAEQAQAPGSTSTIQTSAKPEGNSAPALQEKDVYVTKGDESLTAIAARKDVYGDPLKWILLYRYNRTIFDKTAKDTSFPERPSPAGARLKIATSSDVNKNTRTGSRWVVNVLSFPQQEKIVRDALVLVDNGYPAYIIKATVNGADYLRLRVGFFNEKTAAVSEGQKIAALLNISDIWTTKTGEAEFNEFGGYQ